jgi:excisionase family DNA binding protein
MSSAVLTLHELADYLKLPPETILNQANQGQLPGRKIEDTWRFLKDAIDDWLRAQDSRTILLQQAGAFADDPTLEEMRDQIYVNRGRSEVETE